MYVAGGIHTFYHAHVNYYDGKCDKKKIHFKTCLLFVVENILF